MEELINENDTLKNNSFSSRRMSQSLDFGNEGVFELRRQTVMISDQLIDREIRISMLEENLQSNEKDLGNVKENRKKDEENYKRKIKLLTSEIISEKLNKKQEIKELKKKLKEFYETQELNQIKIFTEISQMKEKLEEENKFLKIECDNLKAKQEEIEKSNEKINTEMKELVKNFNNTTMKVKKKAYKKVRKLKNRISLYEKNQFESQNLEKEILFHEKTEELVFDHIKNIAIKAKVELAQFALELDLLRNKYKQLKHFLYQRKN